MSQTDDFYERFRPFSVEDLHDLMARDDAGPISPELIRSGVERLTRLDTLELEQDGAVPLQAVQQFLVGCAALEVAYAGMYADVVGALEQLGRLTSLVATSERESDANRATWELRWLLTSLERTLSSPLLFSEDELPPDHPRRARGGG